MFESTGKSDTTERVLDLVEREQTAVPLREGELEQVRASMAQALQGPWTAGGDLASELCSVFHHRVLRRLSAKLSSTSPSVCIGLCTVRVICILR